MTEIWTPLPYLRDEEPTYNVAENIEQVRAVANGGQAWEAGLEELAKLFDQFSRQALDEPEDLTWHEAAKYLRTFIDVARPLPSDFPSPDPEGLALGLDVRVPGGRSLGEWLSDGVKFTGDEQGFEHPNADEQAAHETETWGL